jgi:inositol transport system substrate-binding protein
MKQTFHDHGHRIRPKEARAAGSEASPSNISCCPITRVKRQRSDAAAWTADPERKRAKPDARQQEPKPMKKFVLAAAMAAMMSSTALAADKIGVSMALFDDNFLTVLRNGIEAQSKDLGVEVQIEDAQNDVAKQLDQIKNFAASGVTAIIVNPVDTSATQAMSDAAAAANIPLVYVNRQPINVDTLPDNQAFVASNEEESGTLETIEVCKQFKAMGKTEASVYIMMGELSNQAAVQRTKDIHDVMAAGKCEVKLNIIDEQTANWSRDQAQNMMTNWLSAGKPFDGVIANNDEMAIGALQAMKAANVDMKSVVVGGVDATQDALAAMQAGELDVTVFQNAAGQGAGALRAAIALAKGEKVEQKVYIPFELVTSANIGDYMKKN